MRTDTPDTEAAAKQVSLTVANDLTLGPVQLFYYWRGELSSKPLATIRPGKSKTTKTSHGVRWQAMEDGDIRADWTVDRRLGGEQTVRIDVHKPRKETNVGEGRVVGTQARTLSLRRVVSAQPIRDVNGQQSCRSFTAHNRPRGADSQPDPTGVAAAQVDTSARQDAYVGEHSRQLIREIEAALVIQRHHRRRRHADDARELRRAFQGQLRELRQQVGEQSLALQAAQVRTRLFTFVALLRSS